MSDTPIKGVQALSLDEINAQLADAAEALRDQWDYLVAKDSVDQISDWVDSNIQGIRGLSNARRAHIAAIERIGSIYELAERLGWSDVEISHAIDSLKASQAGYGEECVVTTHSGREIRSPAFPQPCDYIRITQHGFELAYWTSEEWKECPDEVMGAIMGALHHDREAPETIDLTATIETQRHRERQEGLL